MVECAALAFTGGRAGDLMAESRKAVLRSMWKAKAKTESGKRKKKQIKILLTLCD